MNMASKKQAKQSGGTLHGRRKPNPLVPYFLLNWQDNRTKALFTVPTHLAETLIQHPILCRGAAFDLNLDSQDQPSTTTSSLSSSTCYLYVIFESPQPEATATAIAERLASRVTDSCENPLSTVFGF